MKKITLAVLCGLLLLAAGEQKARASGCCNCPGYRCFSFGGCGIGIWGHNNMYYGCGNCCGWPTLGPWYQYWPYEAHFATPAPTGYPFWPGPMSAGGDGPVGGGPYAPHTPYYWHAH
jgi:hypothetical protein